MATGLMKIAIYIVSAIMIFLGFIFMISTVGGLTYFFVGLALLIVAGLLLYLGRGKKQIEIKQTLTLSGTPIAKEVKCLNCGAIVDPTKPEIVGGRPYVTCSYCGNKFELTEEPKW